jgi:hypothetical protein
MATPPDFSVGQVLTSAAMNSVGLWRVTGCTVTSAGGTAATASNGVVTVGTGNTSVTVNNAFSSNYDNYRIVFNGGTASNEDFCNFQVGGGAAGSYRWGAQFVQYTNTVNTSVGSGANQARIAVLGTTRWGFVMDVFNPFLTVATNWTSQSSSDAYSWSGSGYSSTAASSTAFTIFPAAGTLTNGTIRVYGYRN